MKWHRDDVSKRRHIFLWIERTLISILKAYRGTNRMNFDYLKGKGSLLDGHDDDRRSLL
jgi:hypothetical protein